MKQFRIIGSLFLILLFSQCQTTSPNPASLKVKSDSPFAKTAIESQYFTVNASEDNIIEGKNGTIIVAPKGCFLDKNGKPVTKNITIELAEALTYDEMIMTGLSTTSDEKPLITDGMIYFYPTKDGELLTINPKKPIYIEVPTNDRKAGMMAYKGEMDDAGKINWVNPKELENYLVKVDLALLDFLPNGFEEAVLLEMEKKGKAVNENFVDSLYYSLSISDGSELLKSLPPTDLNEPYYNKESKVKDGKYEDGSFEVGFNISPSNRNPPYQAILVQDDEVVQDSAAICGIDPALIKIIKSNAYQNTFIATREFEQRMQLLHLDCSQSNLELYLKNLDKDLWKIDSLVTQNGTDTSDLSAFEKLAKQKHTNVQDANIYAELLSGHYQKQLKEVKEELQKAKTKLITELAKASEPTKKTVAEYKEILLKREAHRMIKYSFEWTNTGWVNIDKPAIPTISVAIPQKELARALEVSIENGNDFDQVYSYVIYRGIKSLYRFNQDNKTLFYAGNSDNRRMILLRNEPSVIIAIGYTGDKMAFATQEFNTNEPYDFNLKLQSSTEKKIRTTILKYETSGKENALFTDLEFMQKLEIERKRQKLLKNEAAFIQRLKEIAYQCCLSIGELIHEEITF